MLRSKRYILFVFWALLIASCDSPSSQESVDQYMKDDLTNKMDEIKNVFYMIPSPMETVIMFKKAGLEYHNDLLNDPSAESKYDTKTKKAVNLGIYGADLSYATLNNQNQETMFFVSSAKKLAESLGIMKAFDEQTISRIEDNIENKDSMVHIVSDVYWIADAYLKENESVALSSMIIFGGWLESIYIASSAHLMDPSNEPLKNRLLEQKYTLDNLYLLVSSIKDKDLEVVQADLLTLKKQYDAFTIEQNDLSVINEEEITRIKGSSTIKASPTQVKQLVSSILSLRKKYTSY